MEQTFGERLRNAWNVFTRRDNSNAWFYGSGSSTRQDRVRYRPGNERSIISSIYTRIALDVSSSKIRHVQLDSEDRFLKDVESGFNECMTISANIDQSGRAFLQDIVMSMLDEGCVAIVPVDCSGSPKLSLARRVRTMRTGKITQWYPRHVKVKLYNDRTGEKEEVTLSKDQVVIVENPLYAIMNEPNSTLKRLIRKLSLLDISDEKVSAGKLDLIIQLPYTIKSELRKLQAQNRRKELEEQLTGSQYGIAYADGTERITQLNRSAENNLLAQVEYLTKVLYNQLGMSEAIFDGTADEVAVTNYYCRTVQPLVDAITDGFNRTFLGSSDRKKHEAIQHFRDPFDLVPISKIPEMADKLTRNEIVSSNEIRQIIGMKASADPRADELLNKNMAAKNAEGEKTKPNGEIVPDEERGKDIKMEVKS